MQNKDSRLAGAEIRLHNLKSNGKNVDSPGVVHKLERQIKKMKAEKGED